MLMAILGSLTGFAGYRNSKGGGHALGQPLWHRGHQIGGLQDVAHGDEVGHFEFHLPLGRVVVQYLVHLPMARTCRHDGHMVRTEEVLQADLFLIQPMALAKLQT